MINILETYRGLRYSWTDIVKQGKRQGYVTTLYGRKRPFPNLNPPTFWRQFGEQVAMNSPIQEPRRTL